MTKIHTIKDESLGGVLREYVEVERRASDGDYIVCTQDGDQNGRFYRKGDVGKFLYFSDRYPSIRVKFDDDLDGIREDGECYVGTDSFSVIEPTDIVHIDGTRYRLVDRKAEVGEKVLIVNPKHTSVMKDYNLGDVFSVSSIYVESVETDSPTPDKADKLRFWDYEYRVLVPVTATDDTPTVDGPTVDTRHASPEVIDLLANLARRVTSLEQQLRDTQGNVEKLAEELETKTHELGEKVEQVSANVEMTIDDIVTLDERTQSEKPFFTTFKPTFYINREVSSAKLLAEAFEALAKYERGGARP
ncbi:hypothetical protein [Robertmurraya andreesenii]|uniref:Uncharacterized protein n=1 Tax=Anoxybacillus andreesenii TaxID=1325932 RepID=A0ABT9V1V9_9BACL|nr:hypothetical protein [Robertmurraya andreesenii]MDQ0154941.1 hypothetical protein [Robertmurraya andreesenii]